VDTVQPIPVKFSEYHLAALLWSPLTLYNEVMNMVISLTDVISARVIARIIQLDVRYV